MYYLHSSGNAQKLGCTWEVTCASHTFPPCIHLCIIQCMAFCIALSICSCFSTPVLLVSLSPVHTLSPYPCMLVLYSESPWFRCISVCPGSEMLGNKLHRSKIAAGYLLSYLLVEQWHLTVGPWIKHPVWMLDEVCLGFFPSVSWKKTSVAIFELRGAASSVPMWKGMWGWLRGCRCCSRIQIYPLHCGGK